MSAWDSIFQFEEHNVCIVSQVWIELDKHKKGRSDESWNSRKAIKIIDSLVAGKTKEALMLGIPLIPPRHLENGRPHTGKIFFDFSKPAMPDSVNIDLDIEHPDDRIIMICLAMKASGKRVILVSGDGNCRVRAVIAGIEAEEYLNEAVNTSVGEEDTYKGYHVMPDNFWSDANSPLVTTKAHVTTYEMESAFFTKVNVNEFLVFENGPKAGLKLVVVNKPEPNKVIAELITNYYQRKISGITPRNTEQELALQLLIDERVRGVSIAGLAGSGKTYLALAASLHLVYDENIYDRIIVTRTTTGSDEDIGFLPGTEAEKMDPWMGAVYDNLDVLLGTMGVVKNKTRGSSTDKDTESELTRAFIERKIQIKSMNFMKGRTLNRTVLIIDESQDLTLKKLKMISTRIGLDSKIIFLGNVAQIDNNYLTEHTCGISNFIRAFADSTLTGHITLQKGERSPFATEAEERL